MTYLVNHEHRVFTVEHPKNSFRIDTSNGYPVKIGINGGTPEHIKISGKKYTYIDKKYAEKRMKLYKYNC